MKTKAVRVLIVDDSAVVRKCLTGWLGDNPDIEVVGTASDPYDARDKILSLNPDVITLDIEMPRMDGITFLKLIMQHRPMPVVIVSSLTTAGSRKALEALHSGAVDVMAKPQSYSISHEGAAVLVEKIKAASASQFRRNPEHQHTEFHSRPTSVEGIGRTYHPKEIILIGASTGGTEALRKVLTRLPADLPGICIVQHIPAYFSTTFAKRLDELCSLEVIEAKSGDLVKPGRVLIAPGGYHMLLKNNGAGYTVLLNEGPKVHHQRPAVDVLFESAMNCGNASRTLGIVMTGMGSDGARGLLSLKNAGAETVAQDESSCVVFGMPKEAIKLGAANRVLPLMTLPVFINQHAGTRASSLRPTGVATPQ